MKVKELSEILQQLIEEGKEDAEVKYYDGYYDNKIKGYQDYYNVIALL